MLCKKKLAMYIRLSAEDEDLKRSESKTESNSVANQRKLLAEYIQCHPDLQQYDIVEFCDDGYTGTNFKRPRFMEMMDLIKKREVNAIIVKDLSRFGREYLEVGAYLELILPLFGTRFISVNDGFDSNDYIGTTGGLELALRNLINGLYSRDLSVKVRSAIKTRNRQGKYWGGHGFYGYIPDPKDKHKVIVDEEVRPVIERIFDECIAGKTTAQIAQGLNEDNIPCPAARKKMKGHVYNGRTIEVELIWIASTVRKILNDARYTGKMVTGTRESVGVNTGKLRALPKDQWIVVNDTHEAIISEDVFNAASESLKSRIKTVNQNTAGKREDNLFVCGYCGRKLQKSKGIVTHLFCLKGRTSAKAECADLHVDVDLVKNTTLQFIRVLAKTLVDQEVQYRASVDSELPKIEKRLVQIEKSLSRLKSTKLDLYEDYRSNRITRERFLMLQEQRQNEIDELQREMQLDLEKKEQLSNASEQLDEVLESARNIWALSEYRPEIIRRLVSKVYVYSDGRIELELTSNDDFVRNALNSVQAEAS